MLTEIWAFDASICRSIGASYRGETTYHFLPVSIYELDLSEDINVKPCFCRDGDNCPPKGTFDLFPCVGVSIVQLKLIIRFVELKTGLVLVLSSCNFSGADDRIFAAFLQS